MSKLCKVEQLYINPLFDNTSGLRFCRLNSDSPYFEGPSKALGVNEHGEVVVIQGGSGGLNCPEVITCIEGADEINFSGHISFNNQVDFNEGPVNFNEVELNINDSVVNSNNTEWNHNGDTINYDNTIIDGGTFNNSIINNPTLVGDINIGGALVTEYINGDIAGTVYPLQYIPSGTIQVSVLNGMIQVEPTDFEHTDNENEFEGIIDLTGNTLIVTYIRTFPIVSGGGIYNKVTPKVTDTIYQAGPTGGLLVASSTWNVSGLGTKTIISDASPTPTTIVCITVTHEYGEGGSLSVPILPNNYYKCVGSFDFINFYEQ